MIGKKFIWTKANYVTFEVEIYDETPTHYCVKHTGSDRVWEERKERFLESYEEIV